LPIRLAERRQLCLAVFDLTDQNASPAGAAGAFATSVRQLDTLPQGRGEDGLVRLGKKSTLTVLNSDLISHCLFADV